MSWSYFSPDGNFPSREEIEAQEERQQEAEDKKRLSEAQDRTWKVKLHFDFPPIPMRGFDWCCTNVDYDLGDVQGHGATIQEAIEDWIEGIVNRVDHVDFNEQDVAYTWI